RSPAEARVYTEKETTKRRSKAKNTKPLGRNPRDLRVLRSLRSFVVSLSELLLALLPGDRFEGVEELARDVEGERYGRALAGKLERIDHLLHARAAAGLELGEGQETA